MIISEKDLRSLPVMPQPAASSTSEKDNDLKIGTPSISRTNALRDTIARVPLLATRVVFRWSDLVHIYDTSVLT
jgi:hypothetical protein